MCLRYCDYLRDWKFITFSAQQIEAKQNLSINIHNIILVETMIRSLREQPKPSERMRLSKQQKRQKIDAAVEQNDTASVAAAKKNDEQDNLIDDTFQLLCTHTWLENCKTPFLDLDEKIRCNLFILGYNLRTWHNDIPPPFYSKWNTLKDYQQVAASELGYSESFWNEEAKELSKKCSDAVHAK